MQPRIGHLVFHETLTSICLKVHQDYFTNYFSNIEIVQINTADKDEIISAAKQLESKCDIIISREDTIDFLEKKIQIPIVSRSITLSDILTCIKICNSKGREKAGLILYNNQNFDLQDWPDILGIAVNKYFYGSTKKISQAVLEAKHDNVDIVIGSVMACHCAEKLNIDFELIAIKKDIIVESIKKAINVLRAINKERRITEEFQSLLNYAYEGIILLNNQYAITYVNTKVCQIFKKSKDVLLKENFPKISPQLEFLESEFLNLNNNKSIQSVIHINEVDYVFNITLTSFDSIEIFAIVTISESMRIQEMEWKIRKQLSKESISPEFSFSDILGESVTLKNAKDEARAYAHTNSGILIFGETGTGKELFAQSIHKSSKRATEPFIAINCSALPKDLLESELFGYDKGAFTGARSTGKIGLFELAHKGTVFLDEVNSIPLELQIKLLRVIQEKKITRLGSINEIPIDIRIIAATNENLEKAVINGFFRQDLYYRLNVLYLEIPPLRKRFGDTLLLFSHFVNIFSYELDVNIDIPEQAVLETLENYDWPGNVRELQNFAERFLVFCTIKKDPTKVLKELLIKYYGAKRLDSIEDYKHIYPSKISDKSLTQVKNDSELELLLDVGNKVHWNRTKMSELLGISKTTLWRKIKKAGLSTG